MCVSVLTVSACACVCVCLYVRTCVCVCLRVTCVCNSAPVKQSTEIVGLSIGASCDAETDL